jgi:alkylation response protein AidB-like acyl-CoA dehydrogenase
MLCMRDNRSTGLCLLLRSFLGAHSPLSPASCSEAHRKRYFEPIASFKLPGCFAMTELKHGAAVGPC